ncbi:MAG: YceI family protein [Gemmatimonadota bacterium]
MARWVFEPGHTAAHFRVRHMMVTNVRGRFSDVTGHVDFDPANPVDGAVEARIDTATLWTGEEARDAHLRDDDFLGVDEHPEMVYRGDRVEPLGCNELRVHGELTLRGVAREVPLDVRYLGMWSTPYWDEGEERGPVRRVGFEATAALDRTAFGVDWNSPMEGGGTVVGDEVRITLDVEALESGVVEGI